jgi:hypothetical protein
MINIHEINNIIRLKSKQDIALPHRFFNSMIINAGTNVFSLNGALFSKTFYLPILENSVFVDDLIKSAFEVIETFTDIHATSTKEVYGEYVRVNHKYYDFYSINKCFITQFSKWHLIKFSNSIIENSISENLIGFFDDIDIYKQVELETNFIRKLKIEEILS